MVRAIQIRLKKMSDPEKAQTMGNFFKEGQGGKFLGIPTPVLKQVAKELKDLSFTDLKELFFSEVFEERVLASAILVLRYEKGKDTDKQLVYDFYMNHLEALRDWANVDNSAPYILGDYLLTNDREILNTLVISESLWKRRVAIVSTWTLIRKGQFEETLRLAKILLHDKEDLIHKAVGWMLRELGKRDQSILESFLDIHAPFMPRTMLRYSLEKFSAEKRAHYMKLFLK